MFWKSEGAAVLFSSKQQVYCELSVNTGNFWESSDIVEIMYLYHHYSRMCKLFLSHTSYMNRTCSVMYVVVFLFIQ